MSPGGSRRKSEWIVAIFGIVFVAILAVSFRPGRRPSAGPRGKETMPDVSPDAGQATTVLKGFDYTESVKGKPLFHIQSERTVGYGPAAGLLPNLYVDGHDGNDHRRHYDFGRCTRNPGFRSPRLWPWP